MSTLLLGSFQHPLILLSSFLIAASFLALGNASVLIFLGILIFLLYLFSPPADLKKVATTLLRLKWFYLSIILVYFFSAADGQQVNALTIAAQRIFILMLILIMLGWLMQKTQRQALISGLIQLLSPLRLIGFPVHVLALRIELVLYELDRIRELVTDGMSQIKMREFQLSQVAKKMAELYQSVVEEGAHQTDQAIVLNLSDQPRLIAWLLPGGLFIVLLILSRWF